MSNGETEGLEPGLQSVETAMGTPASRKRAIGGFGSRPENKMHRVKVWLQYQPLPGRPRRPAAHIRGDRR